MIQSLYNNIKNQCGVSIQNMHSDNTREYVSHSLQSFITSHRILHQTLCAHAPQKNGVVEQKNKHFVETTHTLLIHGEIPQYFWGYVVHSVLSN